MTMAYDELILIGDNNDTVRKKIFKDIHFNIEVEMNLKVVEYLDVKHELKCLPLQKSIGHTIIC